MEITLPHYVEAILNIYLGVCFVIEACKEITLLHYVEVIFLPQKCKQDSVSIATYLPTYLVLSVYLI